MRIVLGGNQWDAEIDVHGPNERSAAEPADHGRADEGVSGGERFDNRRVVELSS